MKKTYQKYTKEQALQLVASCYDAGEPIFIIRGQDAIASKAVKKYAETLKNCTGAENYGNPNYNLAEAAEKYAVEILTWQGLNMEKIKLPE